MTKIKIWDFQAFIFDEYVTGKKKGESYSISLS